MIRRVCLEKRASSFSGKRELPVQMPCGSKEHDLFKGVREGELGLVKGHNLFSKVTHMERGRVGILS